VQYIYSNISRSQGVENKVSRQSSLLNISKNNIHRITYSNSIIFVIRSLLFRHSDRSYVREGLFINVLILISFNTNFIIELNRPITSLKGRRSPIILRLRRFFLKILLKKAIKIVCISSEIFNSLENSYKVKAEVYENFFGFNTIITNPNKDVKKLFDLVIVADLDQPWQARDLIESYLLSYPSRKLLHIGDGSLKANNAKSLGIVNDLAQLHKEVSTAKIALSQLGLKRIGFQEATPLKHVDYVTCRLPIISGARDKLLYGYYPVHELKSENVKELEKLIVSIENSPRDIDTTNLELRIKDYSERFVSFCK